MAVSQVNNAAQVQQTTVRTVDTNRDGKVDLGAISQTAADGKQTGIYNVQTPEGRAQFRQALLDLGLSVPDFLDSSSSGMMAGLSAGQQGELTGLGHTVAGMTASGSTGDTASLQGRWADFIGQTNVNGSGDVNALVQSVLREAYLETSQDLAFYAQKVRYYNECKKAIRDELTKARKDLASMSSKAAEWAAKDPSKRDADQYPLSEAGMGSYKTTEFITDSPQVDASGKPVVSAQSGSLKAGATKEDLDAYIKGLEEKLNSVGDDAQLANVDLQNKLQQQQQTLQMMSNISKMLHDTAMAIIRKIGG